MKLIAFLVGYALTTFLLARLAMALPSPWGRRFYLIVTCPCAVVFAACGALAEVGFEIVREYEPRK